MYGRYVIQMTSKKHAISSTTAQIFKNIYWCWHIHLLFSVFPSTCLDLGYCYCLSLYLLFLKICFSICKLIHFTLYRCGLSTWIKVLTDWLIESQWRSYNFCPPPGKHSLHSLITVLIHNLGPLYRFGPFLAPCLWLVTPLHSYYFVALQSWFLISV